MGRAMSLDRKEIGRWLRAEDPDALENLWRRADEVRRANVGDEVHLRGLIEISNYCVRHCTYCGLNAANRKLSRYRMKIREILECALEARKRGYGTVVLQSGEDYGITRDRMTEIIRSIKRETGLALTLSLGERPPADLAAWRAAGADRYLLRFETSDRRLYSRIHPPRHHGDSHRIKTLVQLSRLGYEVGSGVMVGIPGQSYESLSQDLEVFHRLDLDMIGVGPYIPHPDTALAMESAEKPLADEDQVPNTELLTYKVIALSRLIRPDANIPSTTALAALNRENGRELGLCRGANVVMPNLTPHRYRISYEIYPNKACLFDREDAGSDCLRERLSRLGRTIGKGPGARRSPLAEQDKAKTGNPPAALPVSSVS